MGQLIRKDLGNGVYTTYDYDAVGQLLHLINHYADGWCSLASIIPMTPWAGAPP